MNIQWKVRGVLNAAGSPVLLATIRTEHEVIISPDTEASVEGALAGLEDNPVLQAADGGIFLFEFREIMNLYRRLPDFPPDSVRLIDSPWQPFTGEMTLPVLDTFVQALQETRAIRLEGSPATGMTLALVIGTEVRRTSVDERRLQAILAELQAFEQLPPPAALVQWVGVAVGAVAVGIEAWRLYREEQDRARAAQERMQRERERMERERECQQSGDTSSGGPAHDDLIERISRIA